MANRSYPPFGKVKTIVLPTPSEPLTLKEYQEKFGIDLKSFLTLGVEENYTYIHFNAKNSLLLIDVLGSPMKFLKPVTAYDYQQNWQEGSADAITIIGWYNADEGQYEGLEFFIDKNDPYDINSVKVVLMEV